MKPQPERTYTEEKAYLYARFKNRLDFVFADIRDSQLKPHHKVDLLYQLKQKLERRIKRELKIQHEKKNLLP